MSQSPRVEPSLAVVDWRERIFDLYREIRQIHPVDPERAFRHFRETRDELFRDHPASPLDATQRRHFKTLPYFDYRHDLNIEAQIVTVNHGKAIDMELDDDGLLRLSHIASAQFSHNETAHALPVYWLGGYAGGLFIPFQDETNGETTYGGGRYLFDTRKGANLGFGAGTFRLDFNFAYNPSCAYNELWICPLPQPESRLQIAIAAGERCRFWSSYRAGVDHTRLPANDS